MTVMRLLPLARALEDIFGRGEWAQLFIESPPSEEFFQFRYGAALGSLEVEKAFYREIENAF